jgi:hypothetical protein
LLNGPPDKQVIKHAGEQLKTELPPHLNYIMDTDCLIQQKAFTVLAYSQTDPAGHLTEILTAITAIKGNPVHIYFEKRTSGKSDGNFITTAYKALQTVKTY